MDTFSNSAQRLLAVIDDSIANFILKAQILHSRTAHQCIVNPVLVRVSEHIQLLDRFRFVPLSGHLPSRKVCGRETFQCRTNTRILILRNECRFYIVRASIFCISPSGRATSSSSHDWPLLKVKFISCKNIPADMFCYEY